MNLAPFVPLMVHAGCRLIDSEIERDERRRRSYKSSSSSSSYTPRKTKIVFSKFFDKITCVYRFDEKSVGWFKRLFIDMHDVQFTFTVLNKVSDEFKSRLEQGELFIDVYNSLKDKGEIDAKPSYDRYSDFNDTPFTEIWDAIKMNYKFKECSKHAVYWEEYV